MFLSRIPTRVLGRARGAAALLLASLSLALPSSAAAGEGELTYDVYDTAFPVPNKVESNTRLTLAPGQRRTLSLQHVRNPRNTGHNDLILTVKNAFNGSATFWLVKDGDQTLSFPPYLPGADLEVISVECLAFGTIEDTRLVWDALGGTPAELSQRMLEAAQAGAESGLAGLEQAIEQSLAGLSEASLEAQRQLLSQLEASVAALGQVSADGYAWLDGRVAGDFPELHAALEATLRFRPEGTLEDAGEELAALLARLDGLRGEVLEGLRFEPPCDVDVQVIGRFHVSLDEFLAELDSVLASGPVTPEQLQALQGELASPLACLADADRIAAALQRDAARLARYLERVLAELRGLDRRLLGRSGQDVGQSLDRLIDATVKLQAEVVELQRRQQAVDDARKDFEHSYERVTGPDVAVVGSPQVPLPLPSFDPEGTQRDLEVHLEDTERLAAAIEARDAQWGTVVRSLGGWTRDAGQLADALVKLRVSGAPLESLLATLRGVPAFEGPGQASRVLAGCVQASLEAARGALAVLQGMARSTAEFLVPEALRADLLALAEALRAYETQRRALEAAAAGQLAARGQMLAAVGGLATTVATPADGSFAERVSAQVDEVERLAGRVMSEQRRIQVELTRLAARQAELAARTKAVLAALAGRPREEAAKWARVLAAAQGILTVEVELRGLSSSLESCNAALFAFVRDLEDRVHEALFLIAKDMQAEVREDLVRLRATLQRLAGAQRDLFAALGATTRKQNEVIETVFARLMEPAGEPRADFAAFLAEFVEASAEALEALNACGDQGLRALGAAAPKAVVESRSAVRTQRASRVPSLSRGPLEPGLGAFDGLARDLRECNHIARLWNVALEATPGRTTAVLMKLSPLSDAQHAELAQSLEELRARMGDAERCFSEALAAGFAATSPLRIAELTLQAAQLSPSAADVLKDLGSLFNPVQGWSLEAIGQKLAQARKLLASLNAVDAAVVQAIQQAAKQDLARAESSAQCARESLQGFAELAAMVEAQLASPAPARLAPAIQGAATRVVGQRATMKGGSSSPASSAKAPFRTAEEIPVRRR